MSKGNSLATVAPDVAKSWCYDKNKGTPRDYTSRSGYKATWDCAKCGNCWSTLIASRTIKGCGCPVCYSKRHGRRKDGSRRKHPTFAECNHSLLSEWDHDRNAERGLFPKNITLGSNQPVHWVCRQCSLGILHRWVAQPNTRIGCHSGCPYCSGNAVCKCNSLADCYEELAQEWDCSKMRQALVHTLLDQIRIYGGILQAEAAGSRVLMNERATGYKDSSALQRKSLESFHDHLRLQCMLTVDLHPHLFINA